MSDTMKVDWAQPLEAVHRDGRVIKLPELVEHGNRFWPWVARMPDCDDFYVSSDRREICRGTVGDGWTIRNKPAAAVGAAPAEEWGPAIEVGGVRPAWLGYGQSFMYTAKSGVTRWYGPVVGYSGWDNVGYIRLPANHPHYHTEKPAEAPLGVLTGVERLERLEALTARLAAIEVRSFHGDDLVELVHDARGLVVDPDLLKAREIVVRFAKPYEKQINEGEWDDNTETRIALAGIKAGREMGK